MRTVALTSKQSGHDNHASGLRHVGQGHGREVHSVGSGEFGQGDEHHRVVSALFLGGNILFLQRQQHKSINM